MQTAMQDLFDWVHLELKLEGYEHQLILDKITSLYEKEKQQIVDAFETGDNPNSFIHGEQYYNQTFKK